MKRYIIEVPEEIRSCEQCPCLTLDRLDNWYCPTNENVKCSADVKPEGCPLQETTMRSQAEIERLAEIGRAVEFFFEYPYCGSLRHLGDERHCDYITYTEIDEVVNMYKEFKAYRERSGL